MDPWEIAANTYEANRAAKDNKKQEKSEAAAREYQRGIEQARIAEDRLRVNIIFAVPKFELLLRERGAAAQKLLANVQPDRPILFGCNKVFGVFSSVIFTPSGLWLVSGFGGDWSEKVTSGKKASAFEAIEYAVRYGGLKPDEVASWFINCMDTIAQRTSDK